MKIYKTNTANDHLCGICFTCTQARAYMMSSSICNSVPLAAGSCLGAFDDFRVGCGDRVPNSIISYQSSTFPQLFFLLVMDLMFQVPNLYTYLHSSSVWHLYFLVHCQIVDRCTRYEGLGHHHFSHVASL